MFLSKKDREEISDCVKFILDPLKKEIIHFMEQLDENLSEMKEMKHRLNILEDKVDDLQNKIDELNRKVWSY